MSGQSAAIPRRLVCLERELFQASDRADHVDLTDVLLDLGLVRSPEWGFDYVCRVGDLYEPDISGVAALIVPVIKDGMLIDLVACSIASRNFRTRRGIARVLGEDDIGIARQSGVRLPLFEDPLHWLRAGGRGAVIIDWTQVQFALAGVIGVACQSRDLAVYLEAHRDAALRLPRIYFEEVRRAA